jgi:hypothetical protein
VKSPLQLPNFRWLWLGQTYILCASQFWFVVLKRHEYQIVMRSHLSKVALFYHFNEVKPEKYLDLLTLKAILNQ